MKQAGRPHWLAGKTRRARWPGRQIDGQADGNTNRQTVRRTEGQTVGQTDRRSVCSGSVGHQFFLPMFHELCAQLLLLVRYLSLFIARIFGVEVSFCI